ncbi:MAG: hypothetical protein ACKO1J_02640, partial [Tagaea sp.]
MSKLKGIRAKLVALLLVFGVLPSATLALIFQSQRAGLENLALNRLADNASALGNIVDRNLYERYGDVQAFLLNRVLDDRSQWRRPGVDTPLVEIMNGYMAAYGFYRLMVLVDPDGRALAVNTKDETGKPMDTRFVYETSFAGAPWLRKALRGEFLTGKNGFTGTVVEHAIEQEGLHVAVALVEIPVDDVAEGAGVVGETVER